jgi:hypothetical protein
MKSKRPTTTAETEGIEFFADSQRRFEETVDKVLKSPPTHRTAAKPTAANRQSRRGDAKRSR